MKGKLAVGFVAVAVMAALLAAHGSLVQAQPVATITLPSPGAAKQLYPGCNNISLTFANGTASETMVQAVTPAGAVETMWRHNAAESRFEGFSPAAPQASDLLTVNQWDAVWLCVAAAPGVIARPTMTPTLLALPPMAPPPMAFPPIVFPPIAFTPTPPTPTPPPPPTPKVCPF
jgi:hypothetical protein